MKGMRRLFRLGALALVAVLLIAAMTAPAAAASYKTCRTSQMLNTVEIVSVDALPSPAEWDAAKLLHFGDGKKGTYSVGMLEVKFKDINTPFEFDGYQVTASPSERSGSSDNPGTSKALGVQEVEVLVDRPSSVGGEVRVQLNLEPGTKYYITVVALNHNTVFISREQLNQDQTSATTLLSPPFLGGYDNRSDNLNLNNDQFRGAHYLVYKGDVELHSFRWLNPAVFGPYDHEWKVGEVAQEGADILCFNGDEVTRCGSASDNTAEYGITHYRLQVKDVDTGAVEYEERLEKLDIPAEYLDLGDDLGMTPDGTVVANLYYESNFNLADGEYDFTVEAGRYEDRKFEPLSDKAIVRISIPSAYKVFDQTLPQFQDLVKDIVNGIEKYEDDIEVWVGKGDSPSDDALWNHRGHQIAEDDVNSASNHKGVLIDLIAYLNTIYD